MIAEVALACGDLLGESVFWSVATGQVVWIDAVASTVQHWGPVTKAHQVGQVQSSGTLGMIVPTIDSEVIAAADAEGVFRWDLTTGTRQPIAHPEQGRTGVGYNDGKVDPFGRLWVGSFDLGETEPRGCLWLFEQGQAPRLMDAGFAVINGPAFSPTGDVLYLSDSVGKRIVRYRVAGAALRGREIFAHMAPEEGMPDGLTVDAEGCVWCAHWDGARVTRFAPTGERLDVIHMPTPRVTSVAFGGVDLRTLFITTARYGLTDRQRSESPHAGALFTARPGAQGIASICLSRSFAELGGP